MSLCVSGGIGSVSICGGGPEYVYGGWAPVCLWGVGLCVSVGGRPMCVCVSWVCVCLWGWASVCVCL